jgi:hypothetical protein
LSDQKNAMFGCSSLMPHPYLAPPGISSSN